MSGSGKKPPQGVPLAVYRQWQRELQAESPSPAAWQNLLLALRMCKVDFTDDTGNPLLPDGLEAAIHVIHELGVFLNAHDIVQREQLSDPIGRLSHAFVDLIHGRSPELFRPVSFGAGGRALPVAEHNLQAIAAKALHELVLAGNPGSGATEAAARIVASAIKKGRVPGHEQCTAKTVRGWLERITKGQTGKVKVPKALLERWNAPLPAGVGITHQERADFLLNALRQGRSFRWR